MEIYLGKLLNSNYCQSENFSDKENRKKEQILSSFLAAVKACQIGYGGCMELATEADSRISDLCQCIEDILSHGLKSKVNALAIGSIALRQVSGFVSSSLNFNLNIEGPESKTPKFWWFIRELLTKHEYERFCMLRNIKSDEGRGKAWIRSLLNEHSLERYIHIILSDESFLERWYEPWALLRDQERAAMLPNIGAGLDSILFAISIDNKHLCKISSVNSQTTSVIVEDSLVAEPAKVPPKKEKNTTKKKKRKKMHSQIVSSPTDAIYGEIDSCSESLSPSLSPQFNKSSFFNSPESIPSSPLVTGSVASKVNPSSSGTESNQDVLEIENLKEKSVLENSKSVLESLRRNSFPILENSENKSFKKDTEKAVKHFGERFQTRGFEESKVKNNLGTFHPDVKTGQNVVKSYEDRIETAHSFVKTPDKALENSQTTTNLKTFQNSKESSHNITEQLPPKTTTKIPNKTTSKTLHSSIKTKINAKEAPINAKETPTIKVGNSSITLSDQIEDLIPSNIKEHSANVESELSFCQVLEDLICDPNEFSSSLTLNKENSNSSFSDIQTNTDLSESQGSLDPTSFIPIGDDKFKLLPLGPEGEVLLNPESTLDGASLNSFSNSDCDIKISFKNSLKEVDENYLPGKNILPEFDRNSLSGSLCCSQPVFKSTQSAELFPDLESSLKSTKTSVDRKVSTQYSSLSYDELRSAVLEISRIRDQSFEKIESLTRSLSFEKENSEVLKARLSAEQAQHKNTNEKLLTKINSIKKENELLRQQLKKYVSAVQMLGKSNLDSQGEKLDGQEISANILDSELQEKKLSSKFRDYYDEANSYEQKLIQVAEMHGELIEFNERLQKLLKLRDSQVETLTNELVQLRGPLPSFSNEASAPYGDTVSDDSDCESANRALINIWIPTAFLAGPSNDKHHVYQVYVRIKDVEWNVYRRFAQFYEMHKSLCKEYSVVKSYEFPQKKTFGYKNVAVVEYRRHALQKYLRQVVNLLLNVDVGLSNEPSKTSLTKAIPFLVDCNSQGNRELSTTKKEKRKFLMKYKG